MCLNSPADRDPSEADEGLRLNYLGDAGVKGILSGEQRHRPLGADKELWGP